LSYLGDDESLYESDTYEIKAESDDEEDSSTASQDLIEFTKLIKEHDPESLPNDERAIKFWEEHMDITRYLRQLAVEFITGNWDGHQYCKYM
jgi:spore coat protein CotH